MTSTINDRSIFLDVSSIELDTILAGLRLLQGTSQISPSINLVLTDEGSHEPLSLEQIDTLCERINVAPEASE